MVSLKPSMRSEASVIGQSKRRGHGMTSSEEGRVSRSGCEDRELLTRTSWSNAKVALDLVRKVRLRDSSRKKHEPTVFFHNKLFIFHGSRGTEELIIGPELGTKSIFLSLQWHANT